MQINSLYKPSTPSGTGTAESFTKTCPAGLRGILLVMKLTTILLLAGMLQVTAKSDAQTITYSGESVSLEKVFVIIRQQTGYVFFYREDDLRGLPAVSVSFRNTPLIPALQETLKGQPLQYNIQGKTIFITVADVIKKKDIKPDETVSEYLLSEITGVVRDKKSVPLEGVSVVVKGTQVGTTTNADGRFQLSVSSITNVELVFSFVGYATHTVKVGSRTVFDILLEEAVSDLSDIVVVGYGTQRKSINTSAISSLKGEDLDLKSSTKNVGELLQGKAPGVMVRNIGGAPEADPTIRIRGMNSILGNNSALVVIDGLQRGRLRDINPEDIESISILKSVDALAIYGSEGANGVVLITTKQGHRDAKPSLSFSSDVIVSKIDRKLPKINAADWARRINILEMSRNLDRDPQLIFSEEDINEYERTGGYDWQDIIFNTGVSQNYNAGIEGGTSSTSYRVSGSILDKTGIIVNSHFKRYTLQVKLDSKIKNWITVGINWNHTNDVANVINTNVQTDNPVHAALSIPPVYPAYNENGNYFSNEDVLKTKWTSYAPDLSIGNPLANAKEVEIKNRQANNNIFGYVLLNPLSNLSFKVELGVRQSHPRANTYYNNNTYTGLSNNGLGIVTESSSKYLQNSNILSYKNTFGNHHLELTGVLEEKSNEYYGTSLESRNFPIQSIGYYGMGSGGIQKNSSNYVKSFILSYVGRAAYNYAGKYLASVSYRADGSSVFGEKNKWSYFPSGSIGWKASEENFISGLNVFQNLMFRASYGFIGNQAIAPYQSLANISLNGEYPFYGGETTLLGYGLSRSVNPNLKWETTEQKDIGIDITLLRGKLNVSADYYYKVTRDLLQNRETPTYTGISSITDNIGKLSNEGYEFSVSYSFGKRNFKTNTGFNISSNKTTILDLGPVDRLGYAAGGSGAGVNDPLIFLFVGERWGQIYAWQYEGTWKMNEEDQAKQFGQLPGDRKYLDLNKDGVIDSQDRLFIGNIIPLFEYGFNNSISYKNFGMSFQIQGAYGNKIFNVTRSNMWYEEDWKNRWTPENQTDVPAEGYWDQKTRAEMLKDYPSKIAFPTSMAEATSRWVEDGSYIRLRNVTFTYNLSDHLKKNIGVKNLTVYISGKNLITLTKFSGFNPEVSSFGNDKTLGTSFHDYPISKEFNLGLSLSL